MQNAQYRYGVTYKPGVRGQATARKCQDALLSLLSTTVWREVTVIDIARLTGLSPASVYQYYPHLDALALATADRLSSEGTELPEHLALVAALLRFEYEGTGEV